jgi:hypothetical protein
LKKLDIPVKLNPGGGSEITFTGYATAAPTCRDGLEPALWGGRRGYGGYNGGATALEAATGGFGGGAQYGGATDIPIPTLPPAADESNSSYGNANSFNNNLADWAVPGMGGRDIRMAGLRIPRVWRLRRSSSRGATGQRVSPLSWGPWGPSAPAPVVPGQTADGKPAVRVVANPLDNALIIQAAPEQYQGSCES